jgi:hypothetical protein
VCEIFFSDFRKKTFSAESRLMPDPQAGDETLANGITDVGHDNRNRRSCFFGGSGCLWSPCDNDSYLETHQLGGERGETINFSIRIPPFNDNSFPFQIPKLAQPAHDFIHAASHDAAL